MLQRDGCGCEKDSDLSPVHGAEGGVMCSEVTGRWSGSRHESGTNVHWKDLSHIHGAEGGVVCSKVIGTWKSLEGR